jgi:hypothetical protein
MWLLVWFQLINSNMTHYQLGQFISQEDCVKAEREANVLITNNSTTLYCFEITLEEG